MSLCLTECVFTIQQPTFIISPSTIPFVHAPPLKFSLTCFWVCGWCGNLRQKVFLETGWLSFALRWVRECSSCVSLCRLLIKRWRWWTNTISFFENCVTTKQALNYNETLQFSVYIIFSLPNSQQKLFLYYGVIYDNGYRETRFKFKGQCNNSQNYTWMKVITVSLIFFTK